MSEVLSARAALGVASRRKPGDQQLVADARRDLATAKIAQYVADTVAGAPPLTDDQRARLRGLFAVSP